MSHYDIYTVGLCITLETALAYIWSWPWDVVLHRLICALMQLCEQLFRNASYHSTTSTFLSKGTDFFPIFFSKFTLAVVSRSFHKQTKHQDYFKLIWLLLMWSDFINRYFQLQMSFKGCDSRQATFQKLKVF